MSELNDNTPTEQPVVEKKKNKKPLLIIQLIAGFTVIAIGSFVLTGILTPKNGEQEECTPETTLTTSSRLGGSGVDVVGGYGELPTATFDAPLSITKHETAILTKGTGPQALRGGAVTLDFTIYNGDTGDILGQTKYDGTDLQTSPLDEDSLISGLVKGLLCARAGDQRVFVIPPADLLDQKGNPIGDLGKNTSLVVVADLVSTSLARANGKDTGFSDPTLPSVVLDADGVPGITIPKNAPAPTGLKVEVLKKGDGSVVQAGSSATLHYTGALWSNGTVFDSSWSRKTPATLSLNGVVPGFSQALEGQTVGSQILVVVPPELGYGTQDNGTIPSNSTLVFVIDILGATP